MSIWSFVTLLSDRTSCLHLVGCFNVCILHFVLMSYMFSSLGSKGHVSCKLLPSICFSRLFSIVVIIIIYNISSEYEIFKFSSKLRVQIIFTFVQMMNVRCSTKSSFCLDPVKKNGCHEQFFVSDWLKLLKSSP
jgi:hypothetical protein